MMPGELADDPAATRPAVDGSLWRLASGTSIVSAIVAAVGVVFLTAMFAAFAMEATAPAQVLGRINDGAVLLAYLLCAPSVVAVWRLVRRTAPILGALTLALGLASITGIVALQGLLVADLLTFEEQIGMALVAFLALDVWFVVTGYLGARAGALPRGGRMGLLAATYVGYTIWGVWLARRFWSAAGPAGGDR